MDVYMVGPVPKGPGPGRGPKIICPSIQSSIHPPIHPSILFTYNMYPPPCFSTRACFKLLTFFLFLLLFSPFLLLQRGLSESFFSSLLYLRIDLLLTSFKGPPDSSFHSGRELPPPFRPPKNTQQTTSNQIVFFRICMSPGPPK